MDIDKPGRADRRPSGASQADEDAQVSREAAAFEAEMDRRLKEELARGEYTVLRNRADRKAFLDRVWTEAETKRRGR